ncbi:MAG: NAD(P)/FAD-dependent oxidoreductase [Candidatus Poribacteria bacterium]
MSDIQTEIAVIGAGPAGLSASIEARSYGADVILIDENQKPGGQLFKQIHKFFGSQEHYAGIRGYDIGLKLLDECQRLNVKIMLETVVWGIFDGNRIGISSKDYNTTIKAKRIILATGASENPLAFPGWTLPGVMGAGAVQTMMNIHRVLPGTNAIMVGSGNVGLIVAYQLLQAGAKVNAIVEFLPKIGGYLVHASKLLRNGVPILTSHTILEAKGEESVEKAIIVEVDGKGNPIIESQKIFDVDLICIAVGMSPDSSLCRMAGCKMTYIKELGGYVPIHNENMETTIKGIYVAGDLSGIEEASTAIEEGNLAGLSSAESLGYISKSEFKEKAESIKQRLSSLRSGPFGKLRDKAKKEIFHSWLEIEREK